MTFKALATYFEKISATSSRLLITQVLADLFRKLDKNEIGKAAFLLQGRVAPLFEKLEFGMAEKMVIKSICIGLNIEKKTFDVYYKKKGDLGEAVYHFKEEQPSLHEKNLSVGEVYERLKAVALLSGSGSQEKKITALSGLIQELPPVAAKYVVRILLGVMRMGFSDMTILDAYSWMISGDKSHRPLIEKAYHVRPDLGFIGECLKREGMKGIRNIKPVLFTPILMMRAERLSSAKEIIEKLGQPIVEPKYDGFRLQVHYRQKTKTVRLYSRNLEDVSYMYPDVVEGIRREIRADEVILEGEAVGFDPKTGRFLPFQETVQRKRKYDIAEKAKEIPLKFFIFELLYLNGKSKLTVSYAERRKEMCRVVQVTGNMKKDMILVAPEKIISEEKKLDTLFEEAIASGLEGIIAKKPSGFYQPGARGWNWIKFKRSYSSKIEDTIDCVVMGYDFGKGKRAGFGIGAFLVGVYAEKDDAFLTVAKIGTGLTDEEWRELKKRAHRFSSSQKPASYIADKAMAVDVWMNPHIVVEIKADEITRSPVHTAGRIMKASKSGNALEVDTPGYALRFPRLVRFRDDKKADDATTVTEVAHMFKSQMKHSS